MSLEPGQQNSLSTHALRGVLYTASPFVLQLFIGVLFYVFVPTDDMGRFEYALIFVMFLSVVADLGLSAALVQNRNVTEEHFHSAFWTSLFAGATLTIVVIATAPHLVSYIGSADHEKMVVVLRMMVLLLPFAAISGVFRAKMQRDLRFRPMAAAEVFSIVSYSIIAVSMLGSFGVMSAIVGAVVRELALFVGLWYGSSWTPAFCFRLPAVRELLRFSLNLTGSRCISYACNNLPGFVIFPLLGETALAYYRFAHRLTLMPLARISAVIMRVFFPTFASIQDDDALLRRGYLRTAQSIALLYWPFLTLLVFAPEAIELLKSIDGRDLGPASLPLQLLGVASLLKAVGAAVGSIFLAKGRASWLLYWSLFSLSVLFPALYFGVSNGIVGVATVVAGSSVLLLLISQHLTNKLIQLRFVDFIFALIRPTLVTVFVFVCMLALRLALSVDAVTACAIGILGWIVATVLGMRLFAWKICNNLWKTAWGVSP